jgi:HK97 gp10 family phage protein
VATIWFDGIEEMNTITAELEADKGAVGRKAAVVVRRYALEVERFGKLFAPVDTGALKNSITTDVEGDGRFGAITASVGPTVHYGKYVEYGTRYMAPQAYMGPALDRVGPSFVAACAAIGQPLGGGNLSARTGRG